MQITDPARDEKIKRERACTTNHGSFGHGTGRFCNSVVQVLSPMFAGPMERFYRVTPNSASK